MTANDPFGNPLDYLFGGQHPAPKTKPADKPLPAIRGKRIDGTLYVRAEDVADALESQAAESCKRLIAKLRESA